MSTTEENTSSKFEFFNKKVQNTDYSIKVIVNTQTTHEDKTVKIKYLEK